jgi:hypothetical protein
MTYYELDQLQTEAIRLDAVYWLRENIRHFPKSMDMDVSNKLYKKFRFVRCPDGEIVFGDCIVPGITEQDFISL